MALEKWDFELVHSSINLWVRHMMVSKVPRPVHQVSTSRSKP
jgi:hypothetical protein